VNLSAWLEERFCRSTVQIRTYMSSEFNIGYSHSGCIKLLARPTASSNPMMRSSIIAAMPGPS
jgi:hypothetical protein